jgi:hypothetical protein
MRGRPVSSVALGMALAACANAPPEPPTQNAEFARGCWVEKDRAGGRVNAFLRLLPDGPDRPTYSGHLQFVRGIRPGPEIVISVARDGSRASMTMDRGNVAFVADPRGASAGDEGRKLTFSETSNDGGSMILEGREDRLSLKVFSRLRTLSFDGERDGCD